MVTSKAPRSELTSSGASGLSHAFLAFAIPYFHLASANIPCIIPTALSVSLHRRLLRQPPPQASNHLGSLVSFLFAATRLDFLADQSLI
jgi:hypothetical protein